MPEEEAADAPLAGGLTLNELARRIDRSVKATRELLAELEEAGHAQRVGTGWRLTEKSAARFGQHLRNLSLGFEDAEAA